MARIGTDQDSQEPTEGTEGFRSSVISASSGEFPDHPSASVPSVVTIGSAPVTQPFGEPPIHTNAPPIAEPRCLGAD